MNKTFLKVLKYIGVGCIGAVVGIGALIGVSKCSYNQQDHVENSTLNVNKKQASIVDDNVADGIYTYSPKSFSVFMNTTNGVPVDEADNVISESDWVGVSGQLYYDDPDYVSDQGLYDITLYPTFYVAYTSNGNRYLGLNTLRMELYYLGNVNDPIHEKDFNVTLFDRSNAQASYQIGFTYMSKLYGNVVYGNELWTPSFYDYFNYEVRGETGETFTFAKDWNFNSFAQPNYATGEVLPRAKYPVSAWITNNVDRDINVVTPWFESNGMMFNNIEVIYKPATDYIYIDDGSGTYRTYPSNVANSQYTYFYQMVYRNSYSGYSKVVCARSSYSNSGNTYYNYEPIWVGDGYRVLKFTMQLDSKSTFYELLSIINVDSIESINNGFVINNNGDIGLGNVFTLIGQAFAGLVPIMSISIVPGITIGLLLFLPLITGIIILIIWIVKR